MVIDSINSNNIQMIKAEKVTDEWNRTFYKIRAHVVQTVDLKSFRDKQAAQDYLDGIVKKIAVEDADHIVIVSEL